MNNLRNLFCFIEPPKFLKAQWLIGCFYCIELKAKVQGIVGVSMNISSNKHRSDIGLRIIFFIILIGLVGCGPKASDEYLQHMSHAKELTEAGDYDSAKEELNEAIDHNPDLPEAYMLRGYLYMSLGENENAGADFDYVEAHIKDFSDDENKYQAYLNIGNYRYQVGEYDAAIKAFTIVEDADLGDSELYNAIGLAYLALDEFDQAKEYFTSAIDEQADNFYAYGNLARLFLELGEPEVALNEINSALNINTYVPQFYIVKGQILEALDNRWGAIEIYTSAINNWEGYGDAYYLRGDAYLMEGKYLEAIKDFSDAKDYGILEGVLGMGIAYQGLKQYEESIKAFTEYLIQLKAIDLRALYHMAVSYYQISNYDEVVNTIDELLKYESEDTEALLLKAMALERMHDYDQSRIILENILEINPTHSEAQALLDKIENN